MQDREMEWLNSARNGDGDAFARLVDAYQIPIYNLAYRMLGNVAEAEDATQETFVRVYTKLASYQPERKFSSWVFAIASHHCIDRLRARREPSISTSEESTEAWLATSEEGPEDVALQAEARDEIQTWLDELEPNYRVPLILRYWYGMPYQEIADVLQISVQAVKSRLHRARLKMAAHRGRHDGALRLEDA